MSWSQAQQDAIDAIRRVAVDGVAPASNVWDRQSPDRPSRPQIRALFGSWEDLCSAARLMPARQAAALRRRELNAERRRQAAERGLPYEHEGDNARRKRLKRDEKLAQLKEDIREGRVIVKQASAEEMAGWKRAREERSRRYEPTASELAVVPGAEPADPAPNDRVLGNEPANRVAAGKDKAAATAVA